MELTSPVSATTVVSCFSCSIWDVMVFVFLRFLRCRKQDAKIQICEKAARAFLDLAGVSM